MIKIVVEKIPDLIPVIFESSGVIIHDEIQDMSTPEEAWRILKIQVSNKADWYDEIMAENSGCTFVFYRKRLLTGWTSFEKKQEHLIIEIENAFKELS